MAKKVAVLSGGISSEREVSLVSGKACADALTEKGYEVLLIDVTADVEKFVKEIKAFSPDVAFNALHGKWGEDGCVQGILEFLRIPYTHSNVLASSLAMNKNKAKEILKSSEVPCIEGCLISIADIKAGKIPFEKPYVIKPNDEGSSCGVYIIKEGKDLPDFSDWKYGEYVLIEKYIPGKELSVGVLDRSNGEAEAFTVTEIRTDLEFYNYEAKYSNGGSYHVLPAEIPSDIFVKAIDYAELVHKKLGCSGASRTDFRYNPEEGSSGLYFLEINNQPGMTPTSLVPEQAKYRNMSFGDLVSILVETAKLHN